MVTVSMDNSNSTKISERSGPVLQRSGICILYPLFSTRQCGFYATRHSHCRTSIHWMVSIFHVHECLHREAPLRGHWQNQQTLSIGRPNFGCRIRNRSYKSSSCWLRTSFVNRAPAIILHASFLMENDRGKHYGICFSSQFGAMWAMNDSVLYSWELASVIWDGNFISEPLSWLHVDEDILTAFICKKVVSEFSVHLNFQEYHLLGMLREFLLRM